MNKKKQPAPFFVKKKLKFILLNILLVGSITSLWSRQQETELERHVRRKNYAKVEKNSHKKIPHTTKPNTTQAQDNKKEWTVLVYVQANNNLSSFALRNFTDMALVGSNEKLNILIQWYQPHHKGVWRYRVEQGKMILDSSIATETDGNSSEDLTDAMRWAVTSYPAHKNGLILWDHGIGILDPVWGNKKQPWLGREAFDLTIDSEILAGNPRIQIEGLTISKMNELNLKNDLLTTNTAIPSSLIHRGILFNERSKTYMDNFSLTAALKNIKENVLDNKKIDLLGMDACLMAMIEVGYLARDYASILVSSQEVELAHGWPYQSFFLPLATKQVSPQEVAENLVTSFGDYYKNKIQFYTQSAIDLDQMDLVKDSINQVVSAYQACKQKHSASILDMAKRARSTCQQFSIATYIDLCSYFQELYTNATNAGSASLRQSKELHILKQSLQLAIAAVKQSVFANTAGTKHPRAQGLSVYFPQGRIDRSYPVTDFAKDCLWHDFIREVNGH